jgi:hypothetical protein
MAVSPLRAKMARAVFHGGVHWQHFDGSVLQSSGDTDGICRYAFPVSLRFAFLSLVACRACIFTILLIFSWADNVFLVLAVAVQ